ncbi:MAG: AAA family ATPase [Candidatus Eremiobacteraeota bacterium]|nr:AAA family ATPase [Candidatus Eremiobacteraeota bacterium]
MASRLELRFFDRFEVIYDGAPWPFAVPPRAAVLLAYLAVHAGESISRASLATLTWPDDPQDEARGKLRRHLHRIVHALPPAPADAPWIDITASTVRWQTGEPAWSDVGAFEAAASDEATYPEAVELYRGEFLDGYYEDWVLLERERLQARFLEVCYDAALGARRDRNFDAAVRYADRMLVTDEWREDALRLAMTARYEAGDRSGALACFERFVARLRAEMHVEPMPETTALRAVILANAPLPGQHETLPDNFGSAPATTPFVGRIEERKSLESAWLRAARGRGTTMFVGGEAGIGKSRLMAEIGAHVAAQGGRAIFGRTSNPEAFPYESIVDALRRSFPLISQAHLEPIWLSSLAPLLPELHGLHPDLPEMPSLDPLRSRTRLFEAIARIVEHLARSRPLLVVLEDAHWAHKTTLEAMEALARRIGALPVLMLITYRIEEVTPDHALGAVRRSLQSERRASGLTLHGLASDEVERLVSMQPRFDGAVDSLAESVYSLSEGNPLFVNQLLGSYLETGAIPDAGAAARSVGQTILARVEFLAPRERTLAEAAATIGRSFTVETVARVLGWSEAEIFDALGTLLDRGLVRESGDTAFSYAFSHALIAAAIYDSTPAQRRVVRHRRIARVMADMHRSDRRDLATIARHWRLGNEPDLAGEAYALAAEAAVAVGARDETIEYAREALALFAEPCKRFKVALTLSRAQVGHTEHERWRLDLDQLSELAANFGEDERYAALEQWELYYGQIADRERQRETIQAMLASKGAAAKERRARALSSLGSLELFLGNLGQARAVLREALRIAFAEADRPAAALARQRLVQAQVRMGLIDEARHHVEAMRAESALDGSLENRRYLGYAEATLAIALEDSDLYARVGESMLEVAREAGDLDDAIRAHGLLGLAAYKGLDFDAARGHFQQSVDLCERLGQTGLLVSTLVNWGEVECGIGRLREAMELLERAEVLLTKTRSQDKLGYCSVVMSYAAFGLREFARARAQATRARTLAEQTGEHRLHVYATLVLGQASCALGDVETGLSLMVEAIALRRKYEARVPLVDDLCTYAMALLGTRRVDEAATVAQEIRALALDDLEHQQRPARVCWALGRVAQATGDDREAARLYAQGLELLNSKLERMSEADRKAFTALPFSRGLIEASRVPTVAGRSSRRGTRTALHSS